MKVFVVSPSRSISKAFHSDVDHPENGGGHEFFLDQETAEYVRDRWAKRYLIAFEVYEVEARITRKVKRPLGNVSVHSNA